MLHDELHDKWQLSSNTAPLIVGEFGTSPGGAIRRPGEDVWWYDMERFLTEYDLDFAYWSWNGQRWSETEQDFGDEGFGLLLQDGVSIRSVETLETLQRLQETFAGNSEL